jgi:FRG domain
MGREGVWARPEAGSEITMHLPAASSWRELDDAISETSWCDSGPHVHSTLVFRGLARSSYSNVSSLARLSGDYASLERHLVRNFRKYAHRAAPGPTTWDWLSLAQHHGLPTRLLDWTFSPLVALHFATASWPEEEAVLWAVDFEGTHELLPVPLHDAMEAEGHLVFTTELLAEQAPGLRALDALGDGEPFVIFFEPPSLDERIVNQAAVLSAMSDPTHQMDDWFHAHPGLWRAWRIPPALKADIRERLDQANVTERLLLPGLDGLAAWLRRYYSPERAVADPAEGGGSMSDGGDRGGQREGAMAWVALRGPTAARASR